MRDFDFMVSTYVKYKYRRKIELNGRFPRTYVWECYFARRDGRRGRAREEW